MPRNYQNPKKKSSNFKLHVQTAGMSAPKRMLLKHLRYNSSLHSFLSPRIHIYITSENPFREMNSFQNGIAWTRSDADATHMRTASGIIQLMRQTRQIQINKDACIQNGGFFRSTYTTVSNHLFTGNFRSSRGPGKHGYLNLVPEKRWK